MTDSAKLVRGIPVLASLDLDSTQQFYEEKFGFQTINKYHNYLIVKRDDIVLHFWQCSDKYIAENTSCYINVQGIDTLYAEYQAAGVIHPNAPLKSHDYGMREFAALDGDGNLLKFGQQIP